MQSYLPGGAIVHACVIHGSLGLTSLNPMASASLSDGSAVLQQQIIYRIRQVAPVCTVM